MALCIKNPKVEELAKKLSGITGETITEVIYQALKERVERETGKPKRNQLCEEIKRMQNRIDRLPRLDERSDEEILGYT